MHHTLHAVIGIRNKDGLIYHTFKVHVYAEEKDGEWEESMEASKLVDNREEHRATKEEDGSSRHTHLVRCTSRNEDGVSNTLGDGPSSNSILRVQSVSEFSIQVDTLVVNGVRTMWLLHASFLKHLSSHMHVFWVR